MGRTILVGDVHGCARELERLFDELVIGRGDRVLMVGDLVVRGPSPNRVLELVRAVGGLSVRGNHEARLLQWRELRGAPKRAVATLSEGEHRILGNKHLRRTAEEIDDEGWTQLARMPLWLLVPEQELLVVHAGLVPGVPLAKQRERALLNVRGIDEDGEPTERRDVGELWGKRYLGPPHVVFGHNAQAEPQLHAWATGLDTGCVYGGHLTALVLDAEETIPRTPAARKKRLVSVPARRAYAPVK
ncbi:MAG: hypothetical protein EXR75_03940 [Myxococcales bacterium]|nr:hypothetical protein [Myxococcales bacterium]